MVVSQSSQAIILEAAGVISWVSERHAGDSGVTQGAFGVNVSHRDQCGWVQGSEVTWGDGEQGWRSWGGHLGIRKVSEREGHGVYSGVASTTL